MDNENTSLSIFTPVVQTPAVLKYNLSPFRAKQKEWAEKYKNWVITEEDLLAAKDVIGDINKIVAALNDGRIQVSKELQSPINPLKQEVDELIKAFNEIPKSIKEQSDAFENKRKEDKKAEILALPNYDNFLVVFDDKWLNKTTPMKTVITSINDQLKVFSDLEEKVKGICFDEDVDPAPFVEMVYKKDSFETIKKAIDASVRASRLQAVAPAATASPAAWTPTPATPTPVYRPAPSAYSPAEKKTVSIKLKATPAAIERLSAYLKKDLDISLTDWKVL